MMTHPGETGGVPVAAAAVAPGQLGNVEAGAAVIAAAQRIAGDRLSGAVDAMVVDRGEGGIWVALQQFVADFRRVGVGVDQGNRSIVVRDGAHEGEAGQAAHLLARRMAAPSLLRRSMPSGLVASSCHTVNSLGYE